MADLKTTQERRERFRTWLHDDTRDHMSIRAWCVAEDACQDVDTLLAEVAKLRAVAEAAKELLSESQRAGCGCLSQFPCPRCDAAADVAKALAALEGP